MNRRTFIAWASGAAVAGVTGGLAVLPGAGRRAMLPPALADLYDKRFVDAMPQVSLNAIAARLAVRGVLVGAPGEDAPATERGWRFDIDRVGANAANDALVEFGHSLYTETELLLYSFVARL